MTDKEKILVLENEIKQLNHRLDVKTELLNIYRKLVLDHEMGAR